MTHQKKLAHVNSPLPVFDHRKPELLTTFYFIPNYIVVNSACLFSFDFCLFSANAGRVPRIPLPPGMRHNLPPLPGLPPFDGTLPLPPGLPPKLPADSSLPEGGGGPDGGRSDVHVDRY